MNNITELIPICNEDTVYIPIQALTYFSQIDHEITCQFAN